MSVGQYGKVPEEGLGREEQPDGRYFRPSLGYWAVVWNQDERMRTRKRSKQLPAPDANFHWVLRPHLGPGSALPGIQWVGPVLHITLTNLLRLR